MMFKRTPKRGEGLIGIWKSGLTRELRDLEENLDQIYQIIGLQTNSIINNDSDEFGDNPLPKDKLGEEDSNYETIINEYLLHVDSATKNICSMISSPAEHELPIPVHILLRIAAKIGLVRWKDYRKRPNGLLANHVYSLTRHLVKISLTLIKTVVIVLGTNVIPFSPYINQTLLNTLEWTRSSNLCQYDELRYHSIRSQLLNIMSFIVGELSVGINLSPQQLRFLIESELVDSLQIMMSNPTRDNAETTMAREQHMMDSLVCLNTFFAIYSNLLEAPLEQLVKSFTIQTCIGIYRDFESTSVGLSCRRQLLQLTRTIANQPYASSTTEISNHIFELASRIETDPETRLLARDAIRSGLAHRPIIVSHFDVYKVYGSSILDSIESKAHEDSVVNTVVHTEPTSAEPEVPEKTIECIDLVEMSPDNKSEEPAATLAAEAPIQSDVTNDIEAKTQNAITLGTFVSSNQSVTSLSREVFPLEGLESETINFADMGFEDVEPS